MKVGIVGTGAVGAATAMAITVAGCARELVLVNRSREKAKGMATDLRYGAPLWPRIDISDGDYGALTGCDLLILAAGVNEKSGGATDRNDPAGRLRLLRDNAKIYRDIVPQMAAAAPHAPILVLTDPPEPLVEICRRCAGHDRVFASGTYLDSLRFRVHLARHFDVSPESVTACVIGEHGTSSVFLWSAAQIGGVPVREALAQRKIGLDALRDGLEREVREANITIIEGIGASQYGIGMVAARLTEHVLRDARTVLPVSAFCPEFGVPLSLPRRIGREGAGQPLWPVLAAEEEAGLQRSAEAIRKSLSELEGAGEP